MIKKMQKKFILLTLTALIIMLTAIIGGINIVNYRVMTNEADEILAVISENHGDFPMDGFMHGKGKFRKMSPETPYESRFFSVMIKQDSGEVIHVEMSRIGSVDEDQAITYAEQITDKNKVSGFTDRFRYLVEEKDEFTQISFLDCGKSLDAFYTFLRASILMALAGFIIVSLLIIYFSGRIIRPVSESYEKQKQFVTDAGHELKTPLAIINADVDVLKMEFEENEWLDDIKGQINKMTALTEDLVILSKMEEDAVPLSMIEFPVSDIIEETASSFIAAAQTQNKKLSIDIEPMLSMKGNEKSISQLISILMDNAIKYSPEDGSISVKLSRQNKNLILSVSNTSETEFTREDLTRIFDRFYRTDQSRNSETGGHGIGLSIAKAIVEKHKGKIYAQLHNGNVLEIQAVLPC